MNSLRDFQSNANSSSAEDAMQSRIEDYLDYLCAPLVGIVPYSHRRRLRMETADHLSALIEDFISEGFSSEEAVTIALREYGEPWEIGQGFADAWLGGAVFPYFARFADAATLRAFGCFGILTVVTLLSIEWYALGPYQQWLLPLIQCVAVVSPIAAGALTGAGLDSRAGMGICRCVILLAIVSAVVGLLLRPHGEGLTFAVFQAAFWLPVGCLSATAAASLRRQFQCQRFRSTER